MKKLLVTLCAIVGLTLLFGTVQLFAAPGDSSDPVITLSYINDVLIPKLQDMFQGRTGQTFVVVEVPKGKTVLCDGGTELVLRQGAARVVATKTGGLADVTAGYDIGDGGIAPSNHQLIVPRGDGRGVTAVDGPITLLVKGNYQLQGE